MCVLIPDWVCQISTSLGGLCLGSERGVPCRGGSGLVHALAASVRTLRVLEGALGNLTVDRIELRRQVPCSWRAPSAHVSAPRHARGEPCWRLAPRSVSTGCMPRQGYAGLVPQSGSCEQIGQGPASWAARRWLGPGAFGAAADLCPPASRFAALVGRARSCCLDGVAAAGTRAPRTRMAVRAVGLCRCWWPPAIRAWSLSSFMAIRPKVRGSVRRPREVRVAADLPGLAIDEAHLRAARGFSSSHLYHSVPGLAWLPDPQ